MDVQPAAAQGGRSGGIVAGPGAGRPAGGLVRSRALSLRCERQAERRTEPHIQGDRQRPSRPRGAAAAPVRRHGDARTARPRAVRRTHQHRTGEDLRPLSEERRAGGRLRCRHRDLGRQEDGHALGIPDARPRRLYALRRDVGDRMAGDRAEPRTHCRARRRAQGRARLRALPATPGRRGRATAGPARSRDHGLVAFVRAPTCVGGVRRITDREDHPREISCQTRSAPIVVASSSSP